MDSISELRDQLSDLYTAESPADSTEETSSCDSSPEGAMEGEGQRAPDEGLKDLLDKVQKADAEDYTTLFFGEENANDNIQQTQGISKVTGWFVGVTFEECLLLGKSNNITDCRMTNVTFRGCTFTDATWAELGLEDVDFEDCEFEDHLWRCRPLHNKRFKDEKFVKETSLGEDIPLETDSAFWVKKQQYAFIAASQGGDAALARHIQAKEEEERDRKLATQFSTDGDASRWEIPDANLCQSAGFQAADAARRAAWVPSPMNSWG